MTDFFNTSHLFMNITYIDDHIIPTCRCSDFQLNIVRHSVLIFSTFPGHIPKVDILPHCGCILGSSAVIVAKHTLVSPSLCNVGQLFIPLELSHPIVKEVIICSIVLLP